MKISLLKISRKKMVINRLELKDLAEMIRKSPEEQKVFNLRLNYQFYQPKVLYKRLCDRSMSGQDNSQELLA